MQIKVALFVILGIAFLSATTAQATKMIKIDFPDLTLESDAIFIGEVTSVTPRWTLDKKSIVTTINFNVLEIWKGNIQVTRTFSQFGGAIGDTDMAVDGLPRFETGRRYVIFMREGPYRLSPVLGYTQGQFRIEPSKNGDSSILTGDNKPVLGIEKGHLRLGYCDERVEAGVQIINSSQGVKTTCSSTAANIEKAVKLKEFRRSVFELIKTQNSLGLKSKLPRTPAVADQHPQSPPRQPESVKAKSRAPITDKALPATPPIPESKKSNNER